MALRQPPPIEVQQEVEEEGVSGPGDGDEVMEEAEAQDDGYSAFESSTNTVPRAGSCYNACLD